MSEIEERIEDDREEDIIEAIHIMLYSHLSSEFFTQEGLYAAYVTALRGLMTKLPQEAEKSDSGEYYICPCCKRLIEKNERAHGNIDIPFCKWCGQALEYRGE